MGALDLRAPGQDILKMRSLYQLLPTPGYREGEEICKYLAT